MVIIGAGAAGMMCAIEAGKRGRSVILVDHARKLAEKSVSPVVAAAILPIVIPKLKIFSPAILILPFCTCPIFTPGFYCVA